MAGTSNPQPNAAANALGNPPSPPVVITDAPKSGEASVGDPEAPPKSSNASVVDPETPKSGDASLVDPEVPPAPYSPIKIWQRGAHGKFQLEYEYDRDSRIWLQNTLTLLGVHVVALRNDPTFGGSRFRPDAHPTRIKEERVHKLGSASHLKIRRSEDMAGIVYLIRDYEGGFAGKVEVFDEHMKQYLKEYLAMDDEAADETFVLADEEYDSQDEEYFLEYAEKYYPDSEWEKKKREADSESSLHSEERGEDSDDDGECYGPPPREESDEENKSVFPYEDIGNSADHGGTGYSGDDSDSDASS